MTGKMLAARRQTHSTGGPKVVEIYQIDEHINLMERGIQLVANMEKLGKRELPADRLGGIGQRVSESLDEPFGEGPVRTKCRRFLNRSLGNVDGNGHTRSSTNINTLSRLGSPAGACWSQQCSFAGRRGTCCSLGRLYIHHYSLECLSLSTLALTPHPEH